MNSIGRIYLLLAFIATIVNCSHDGIDLGAHGGEKSIAFSTNLVHTRGNPYTEGGDNDFKSMGVYSSITNTDWNATHSSIAGNWNNIQVTRDSGSTGWYYTPPKSWTDQKHTFFAYAPYSASGLAVTATTGVPMMQFTVNDASANQIDLLVAEAQYNKTDTTTSKVQLKMHHALSRLYFSAKLTHSVPVNTEIKLSRVSLSHLKNTATRPMDFKPTDLWSSHSGDQNYALNNNQTQMDGNALTQTLRQVTLSAGNLYLIPQSFLTNTNAELSVTYETYEGGSLTAVKTVTTKLSDIVDAWMPSEAIHFILTIPNPAYPEPFTIDVVHEPWDNVDLSADIDADPYLDITNVSVSTYDAAITRVYYYTNVPANQVTLDPVGKINTNNGASFYLKNEFYAISSDDPDGEFNFHKPIAGRGWIDFINRNTLTAGDRPNFGKYPFIIKLMAGKLSRDIVVQPIVTTEAAKQNPTPYIGTFHRWNELSERIVTWHLPPDKEWTATIVDEAQSNHAELCIDRLASPDYANNVLYSFVPREAQGAYVDGALRSVKGKGRVYFRVGWRSASPSSSTNRYARIKVTVDGTDQYLYCRQGEMEQVITNAAPSFFAVYNVGQFRQFVNYPTQVGMFYQWNDRKGWSPLGKNSPVGYSNLAHPAPYSYERSACPDGYLVPQQNELNQMTNVINNNMYLWGYYADGFFDRYPITPNDHRVDASTLNVGAAGILFFNGMGPLTGDYVPRAIFLPTGGVRISHSNTYGLALGELAYPGTFGGYFSSVQDATNPTSAGAGLFWKPGYTINSNPMMSQVSNVDKDYGFNIRCIKPSSNSLWIVRFDPNGGENAPLAITIPTSQLSISIPSHAPNNFLLDGYDFVGWTTDKSGAGTVYVSGNQYIPTVSSPGVNVLYAKWYKDPYLKIDFREFMNSTQQTTYLLSSSSSYNGYYIGANTNGSYYALESDVISGEKAFPKLKWSEVQPSTTWSLAYGICKTLPEDGGGWRLPRLLEMKLVSAASPINALKKRVPITILSWTGTQSSATNVWGIYETGVSASLTFATGNRSYRCVKEMQP